MNPTELLEQLNQLDEHTRSLNSVDPLHASNHLRRLRDRGLLKQKGSRFTSYYVPTPALLAPWIALSQGSNLPDDLRATIHALGKRIAQSDMEDLIVRLCRWQPLSIDELSGLLDRNRTYLRNRLIGPMLRTGKLAMTIPDQPNHPNQRYRSANG